METRTIAAFHVEAKLHAFRKTQDGVVVSFVLSPIDVPPQLALDPLGQRYMLALAQIGDDETPTPMPDQFRTPYRFAEKQPTPASPHDATERSPDQVLLDAQPAGERSPNALRSQQAKAAYAAGTPGEQAVVRAALLCKDRQFQAWVHPSCNGMPTNVATVIAKDHIKTVCGGIASRSELAIDPEALNRFLAMELQYKLDTGALPEMRG